MRALPTFVKRRLAARLAARGDLLATALGGALMALVGPVFIWTLTSHLPQLGGWTGAELLFCWGFAEAGAGLYYVLFQGLFALNPRYLMGGELDRLMTRPMDPLVQLLAENLSLEDLPTLAIGGVVMALAVHWGLPPVPAWRWAFLPLSLAAAAATLGGLATAVASLGFLLRHRGASIGMLMQMSGFSRYPMDLFPPPLRWILSSILPLGFAGFYGAAAFLDQPRWWPLALAQPLVGGACLLLGLGCWRLGLRRYASTGT